MPGFTQALAFSFLNSRVATEVASGSKLQKCHHISRNFDLIVQTLIVCFQLLIVFGFF
jgi:hypothetical protein